MLAHDCEYRRSRLFLQANQIPVFDSIPNYCLHFYNLSVQSDAENGGGDGPPELRGIHSVTHWTRLAAASEVPAVDHIGVGKTGKMRNPGIYYCEPNVGCFLPRL